MVCAGGDGEWWGRVGLAATLVVTVGMMVCMASG